MSASDPTPLPELSVVIPAYNEEETIEEVLWQVINATANAELIVVNDGSTDRTPGLIDRFAQREPRVRVFHLEKNSGKGAAVRRGIQEATGELVVIQDGDLEYDPADFAPMIAELRRLDTPVLYGSRRLHYRSAAVQWRYYWGGVVVTWVCNLLFRSRLTDEATCYKMWRRELIQDIDLKCDGFEFCPEVTAKVLRRGIKIPEIQIRYQPRTHAEGKKIKVSDGAVAIWTLIKLRFSRAPKKGAKTASKTPTNSATPGA